VLGLTAGEQITQTIAETNAGTDQVDDSDLRYRYGLALQWAGNVAWAARSYKRRLTNGTVTIDTDGTGLMPIDFASPGGEMKIFLQDNVHELVYLEEGDFFRIRQRSTAAVSRPTHYTFRGQDAYGFLRLWIYPRPSEELVLSVENYVAEAPIMIDRPRPVTLTAGTAGLLNGAYTYAVSFVHPEGETELSRYTTISVTDLTVLISEIHGIETPFIGNKVCTGRKIYRLDPGETVFRLLATLDDMTTTTFTDTFATPPFTDEPPEHHELVTGLTRFPATHHATTMRDLMLLRLARKKGDGRSGSEFPQAVAQSLAQMWADDNTPFVPGRQPRYGSHWIHRRS
jgi:hypothetical protein